ncbi:universal stress protein [Halobellus sp. GM3]|uniref:universal stress protein n=1 Tax=Halobellus sp. GM3 TaxID=3458410 RepID=UPI00403D615C
MTHDAVGHIRRILVPVDGSESADSALDHAITLAGALDAEVHLVAVVDPYGLSTVTERREVEDELEAVVASAAERVREAGVSVETAVEAGFPHKEILRAVAERSIDMIAMGTHGRRGLDRYVLGSVAEKVVRLSPVPVLTARVGATGERPYREIVVPTDGSDAAAPAERLGVDLAGRFDAVVHALSVVPDRRFRTSETDSAYEEAAQSAVDRVGECGARIGVETDGAVEHGVPHRAILDHCEAAGADLVVLGTHGRTGVERFVLGSVAEKVVRLSETPVLVVPASGAERAPADE